MTTITRREFLRLSAVVAAGATAACGQAEPVASRPIAPPASTSRVAAVRGHNLYTMTRDGLDAIGGIEHIVHPGERVFIKPNMVSLPWARREYNPFLLGECTKPEIVIAVAEACLHAGAAEVIIGDGSQRPRFDWTYATTLDGATTLVAEVARLNAAYAGTVRLVCCEVDSPAWVEIATTTALDELLISSLVTQADRVISIAVLKTHSVAGLTLSLKNFIGITPQERYGCIEGTTTFRTVLHQGNYTPQAIAQLYLDIVTAIKPDLAIIDASIGLEGNGPTTGPGQGTPVDMKDRLGAWLLLAGTDPVAVDATAARVVNHDAAYVDHVLSMAYARGMGLIEEASIDIVGERLDDLRVEWKPAQTAASRHSLYGYA